MSTATAFAPHTTLIAAFPADRTLPNTELVPGLSETEWAEIGKKLAATEQGSCWQIGDWMVYGEKNYSRPGDKHRAITLAVQATGLEKVTIRAYAEVARKVQNANRVSGLSWKLHREVRNLAADRQKELLLEAETFGYSAKELRATIKGGDAAEKAKPIKVSLTPEILAKLKSHAGNTALSSFLASAVIPEWLEQRETVAA
jgi:hypothetical protein